jgi:hypothetical protein
MTLSRQIGCQFEAMRKIAFTATDVEGRNGRLIRWELRAKEAPKHTKANWRGSAWIMELITSTTTNKGKRDIACNRFIACRQPQMLCSN